MTHNALLVGFLVSLTLPTFAMHSFTVNGKNIKEMLKPGELLSCSNDDNNISFQIKNGAIELGSVTLSDEQISKLKQIYKELDDRKATLPGFRVAKEADLGSSKGPTKIDTSYFFSGGEHLHIYSGLLMTIKNSILESPKIIYASCPKIVVSESFIVAPMITIESKVPTSLIRAIRFIFAPEVSAFACMHGILDFTKDETEGSFTVVGAKKLQIQFAPEVFE